MRSRKQSRSSHKSSIPWQWPSRNMGPTASVYAHEHTRISGLCGDRCLLCGYDSRLEPCKSEAHEPIPDEVNDLFTCCRCGLVAHRDCLEGSFVPPQATWPPQLLVAQLSCFAELQGTMIRPYVPARREAAWRWQTDDQRTLRHPAPQRQPHAMPYPTYTYNGITVPNRNLGIFSWRCPSCVAVDSALECLEHCHQNQHLFARAAKHTAASNRAILTSGDRLIVPIPAATSLASPNGLLPFIALYNQAQRTHAQAERIKPLTIPPSLQQLLGKIPSYDLCRRCELDGDLMCCDTCPLTYHPTCLGMKAAPEGDWQCDRCLGIASVFDMMPLGTDDECAVCGAPGELICCDGCPRTYHQACAALPSLPEGLWRCVVCEGGTVASLLERQAEAPGVTGASSSLGYDGGQSLLSLEPLVLPRTDSLGAVALGEGSPLARIATVNSLRLELLPLQSPALANTPLHALLTPSATAPPPHNRGHARHGPRGGPDAAVAELHTRALSDACSSLSAAPGHHAVTRVRSAACSVCTLPGDCRFCTRCKRGYHALCLGLRVLPPGWTCPVCVGAATPSTLLQLQAQGGAGAITWKRHRYRGPAGYICRCGIRGRGAVAVCKCGERETAGLLLFGGMDVPDVNATADSSEHSGDACEAVSVGRGPDELMEAAEAVAVTAGDGTTSPRVRASPHAPAELRVRDVLSRARNRRSRMDIRAADDAFAVCALGTARADSDGESVSLSVPDRAAHVAAGKGGVAAMVGNAVHALGLARSRTRLAVAAVASERGAGAAANIEDGTGKDAAGNTSHDDIVSLGPSKRTLFTYHGSAASDSEEEAAERKHAGVVSVAPLDTAEVVVDVPVPVSAPASAALVHPWCAQERDAGRDVSRALALWVPGPTEAARRVEEGAREWVARERAASLLAPVEEHVSERVRAHRRMLRREREEHARAEREAQKRVERAHVQASREVAEVRAMARARREHVRRQREQRRLQRERELEEQAQMNRARKKSKCAYQLASESEGEGEEGAKAEVKVEDQDAEAGVNGSASATSDASCFSSTDEDEDDNDATDSIAVLVAAHSLGYSYRAAPLPARPRIHPPLAATLSYAFPPHHPHTHDEAVGSTDDCRPAAERGGKAVAALEPPPVLGFTWVQGQRALRTLDGQGTEQLAEAPCAGEEDGSALTWEEVELTARRVCAFCRLPGNDDALLTLLPPLGMPPTAPPRKRVTRGTAMPGQPEHVATQTNLWWLPSAHDEAADPVSQRAAVPVAIPSASTADAEGSRTTATTVTAPISPAQLSSQTVRAAHESTSLLSLAAVPVAETLAFPPLSLSTPAPTQHALLSLAYAEALSSTRSHPHTGASLPAAERAAAAANTARLLAAVPQIDAPATISDIVAAPLTRLAPTTRPPGMALYGDMLPLPAGISPLSPFHADLLLGPLLLAPGDACWAHLDCAYWAPRVFHSEQGLHNVAAEVLRARTRSCRVCHKGGAALGCVVPHCRHNYHLRCAREAESGCALDYTGYTLLCPEHYTAAALPALKTHALAAGVPTLPVPAPAASPVASWVGTPRPSPLPSPSRSPTATGSFTPPPISRAAPFTRAGSVSIAAATLAPAGAASDASSDDEELFSLRLGLTSHHLPTSPLRAACSSTPVLSPAPSYRRTGSHTPAASPPAPSASALYLRCLVDGVGTRHDLSLEDALLPDAASAARTVRALWTDYDRSLETAQGEDASTPVVPLLLGPSPFPSVRAPKAQGLHPRTFVSALLGHVRAAKLHWLAYCLGVAAGEDLPETLTEARSARALCSSRSRQGAVDGALAMSDADEAIVPSPVDVMADNDDVCALTSILNTTLSPTPPSTATPLPVGVAPDDAAIATLISDVASRSPSITDVSATASAPDGSAPAVTAAAATKLPCIADALPGLLPAARAFADALLLPLMQPGLLAQFAVTPSSGMLLYGPPGTGKTSFARAVARACDGMVVEGGDPGLGESVRAIAAGWRRARAAAIDALVRALCEEVDGDPEVEEEADGDSCSGATRVLQSLVARVARGECLGEPEPTSSCTPPPAAVAEGEADSATNMAEDYAGHSSEGAREGGRSVLHFADDAQYAYDYDTDDEDEAALASSAKAHGLHSSQHVKPQPAHTFFLTSPCDFFFGPRITVFVRRGGDLLSRFQGESERQVRELVALARACAPSIVLVDELDALAPARNPQQPQVHASIVATLLAALDGLNGPPPRVCEGPDAMAIYVDEEQGADSAEMAAASARVRPFARELGSSAQAAVEELVRARAELCGDLHGTVAARLTAAAGHGDVRAARALCRLEHALAQETAQRDVTDTTVQPSPPDTPSPTKALLALADCPARMFLLATTNRPDAIDAALRRPGRLDREVVVPLPTTSDRAIILAKCLGGWPRAEGGTWAREGVWRLVCAARETEGMCGADVEAVCREALLAAARRRGLLQHADTAGADVSVVTAATSRVAAGASLSVSETDLSQALLRVAPSHLRSQLGMGARPFMSPSDALGAEPALTAGASAHVFDSLWACLGLSADCLLPPHAGKVQSLVEPDSSTADAKTACILAACVSPSPVGVYPTQYPPALRDISFLFITLPSTTLAQPLLAAAPLAGHAITVLPFTALYSHTMGRASAAAHARVRDAVAEALSVARRLATRPEPLSAYACTGRRAGSVPLRRSVLYLPDFDAWMRTAPPALLCTLVDSLCTLPVAVRVGTPADNPTPIAMSAAPDESIPSARSVADEWAASQHVSATQLPGVQAHSVTHNTIGAGALPAYGVAAGPLVMMSMRCNVFKMDAKDMDGVTWAALRRLRKHTANVGKVHWCAPTL